MGPVSEAEFETLVQNGTIRADTLVWREGMPNWQAYGQVFATARAPVGAGVDSTGQVVCNECGRIFAREDVVQLDNAWVCAGCKPAALQKMREGINLSGTYEYAGFWIRFLAKFIDGLIIGLPLGLLFFAYALKMSPQMQTGFQVGWQAIIQLIFMAVGLLYNTYFIGKYAATPGKMACKIKVITASGEKVTYARAFGRYFGEILSGLICNIGYIMAGFDSQKRALHDHICNTRVVRR
jgi:uncharacterized RDD family membrane protein YckC